VKKTTKKTTPKKYHAKKRDRKPAPKLKKNFNSENFLTSGKINYVVLK